MRKAALFVAVLAALVGLAEAIVLFRAAMDPWRLAAVLGALALTLSAFAAFTQQGFIRRARHWVNASAGLGLCLPLLLIVPYLLFAFGTRTFSLRALERLAAYVVVPTALLMPDRLRGAERVGWRDFAAMAALGVPVAGHWLEGIWYWPVDLYFFRPLYSVCAGAWAFMVVRKLEDVGYRLGFRKGDVVDGLSNFAAFGIIAIPLGISLGFINPHGNQVSLWQFGQAFFGTYITIAIPEEFLFRGILQNFLIKSIFRDRGTAYGVMIASLVFGVAHLHHTPVPNWKYGILATLAGVFYGNAYRTRKRLSAPALSHTLVDTVWHFWF